ncbi:MAG TPA: hypothetical protein VMS38_17395 [Pseudorhodoferax sp.]|jgi:hypothetical protein|nr:hypothetical protein [Pseudorhodoferax sp.]
MQFGLEPQHAQLTSWRQGTGVNSPVQKLHRPGASRHAVLGRGAARIATAAGGVFELLAHTVSQQGAASQSLPDWQAAASFTYALGRFAADPLA